ncbi:hypothetical protein FJY63_13520 [Candidatus Sumerlaeota bacterium]|nr:hypothetical protein [Candidatus Sumerlaeota bacterium]
MNVSRGHDLAARLFLPVVIGLAWSLAAELGLAAASDGSVSEKGTATTSPTTSSPVNLVKNGGFELGDKWPAGWLIRWPRKELPRLSDIHALDGLTLFWDATKRPSGKCIRMDTDVDQKEVHKRMIELLANPDSPPWPKTPTRPPKYDTVGGLEGVGLWSEPIAVEKGKIYRMSVECMGRMEGIFFPKMFVHGYGMAKTITGTMEKRELYNTYLACRVTTPGMWCRFEQTFCPTDQTPSVTEIRVKIYAYWPVGIYYWDNVAIVEVPETEAAAIRSAREKERAKAANVKPRPTPRVRKPGDLIVIEEEEPMTLPVK